MEEMTRREMNVEKELFAEKLRVVFRLDPLTGKSTIFIDGTQVGDSLSDNSYRIDHYRFHDVFHFAFATFLNWSPCVRHLLRLKRKSDPVIDEVEDGARARSIEEGISAILFEEALDTDFFRAEPLSEETLKTIIKAAKRLEVKDRPIEDWKAAIESGYRAFLFLVENQGGQVEFDRVNKKITCSTLTT